MIFRLNNGKIININKYDFVSDKSYHEKILSIVQRYENNTINKTNKSKPINNILSKL